MTSERPEREPKSGRKDIDASNEPLSPADARAVYEAHNPSAVGGTPEAPGGNRAWKLSQETIETGRAGLAKAREALKKAYENNKE